MISMRIVLIFMKHFITDIILHHLKISGNDIMIMLNTRSTVIEYRVKTFITAIFTTISLQYVIKY